MLVAVVVLSAVFMSLTPHVSVQAPRVRGHGPDVDLGKRISNHFGTLLSKAYFGSLVALDTTIQDRYSTFVKFRHPNVVQNADDSDDVEDDCERHL